MKFCLLLVAVLTLAACSDADAPAPSPRSPLQGFVLGAQPIGAPSTPQTEPAGALHYLALGDSYTIGEHVRPEERWPVQLAEALRHSGAALGEPHIIARTGWTTGELMTAMNRAALKPRYDLVTLLIGVNNQFRGRSLQEYRKEFAQIVDRSVALAGGKPSRVVVLSIPDYGMTPFGRGGNSSGAISKALDQFNAANLELSQKAGVRYVDITPGSRRVADDPTLVAGDGLHPSGKMYAQWAAAAFPVAMAALGLPLR